MTIGEPFPAPYEDVPGLIPGNHRRKAGKPSYEELEQALCGLEGERNVHKVRTVTVDMQREFAAMGGVVVKEHGELVILCDTAAAILHYQSS